MACYGASANPPTGKQAYTRFKALHARLAGTMMPTERFAPHKLTLLVAALAILSYVGTLDIPLIEDDYPNILQALQFSEHGWFAPLLDSTFRFRATSYWVMSFNWWLAGHSAAPWLYHLVSIALHGLNSVLFFTLVLRWSKNSDLAFFAAAFFAVYEGHQEAVMWYSGINELLLFFFGITSLLVWSFRNEPSERWWTSRLAVVLSWSAFSLACLSKESAITLLPLFFVGFSPSHLRMDLRWEVFGFVAIAVSSVLMMYYGRNDSFRFTDGSFNLGASFGRTLLLSQLRLFWFWGALAIGYSLIVRRWRVVRMELCLAFALSTLLFLPYLFLTYMDRVPSRQTYMASAALAFVVGSALNHAAKACAWRHFALVCVAIAFHNIGYISLVKRRQFINRAEPTEKFLAIARTTNEQIYIACFPRPKIIAQAAAQLVLGRQSGQVVVRNVEPPYGAFRYCDASAE